MSIVLREYCISLKELIAFKEKQRFPYFFKEYHTLLIKGTLYINTKEFHFEIWNYVLMSEEILHPFQRDDALSWRTIFQIVIHVINIHFKECHDHKRTPWYINIYIYIYIYICAFIYKWTLIWTGVGICLQKAQYFNEIVYALKVYFRPLLHSFQRYYNLSKGMHKVRPHFL